MNTTIGTPSIGTRVQVRRDDLSPSELHELSTTFENWRAVEIIDWAVQRWGSQLVVTTSLADAVLIDLALSVDPAMEVVFVDTGYHFDETLATLEAVRERYQPELRVLSASGSPDDRWQDDPDRCCQERKVEPLDRFLVTRSAWMSGLRRADSAGRANTPIIGRDRRGLVKLNPLATWSDTDVERYISAHEVPVNPLTAQGYPSVGCRPCTNAVEGASDRRSGRWAGTTKTECGLHL